LSNTVTVNDFVPYELDDLAVIVPHASRYPNRWRWFWPQYAASVPRTVLGNTIVVYHNRDGGEVLIPDAVRDVEETSKLVICDREGRSAVWPTIAGLRATRSRIIASIQDDVEILNPGWVEDALDIFNEEPHIKILALVTMPGPGFHKIERICYEPWVRRLLRDGDYDAMSYIQGSARIANRSVWLAYYADLMEDFTVHDGEDVFFTIFARADGIPTVQFAHNFRHRGKPEQDIITD